MLFYTQNCRISFFLSSLGHLEVIFKMAAYARPAHQKMKNFDHCVVIRWACLRTR